MRVNDDDANSKELAQEVIVCCMLLTLRCSTWIVAGQPARHHIKVKSFELRLSSLSFGKAQLVSLLVHG